MDRPDLQFCDFKKRKFCNFAISKKKRKTGRKKTNRNQIRKKAIYLKKTKKNLFFFKLQIKIRTKAQKHSRTVK